MIHKRVEDLWSIFYQHFQKRDSRRGMFRAPGRVNLIGEHTDYNNGFVLPVAIDKEILMLGQTRSDDRVSAYALDIDEEVFFSIEEDLRPAREKTWQNYLSGVLVELLKKNLPIKGVDLLFTGTIPKGAGLSSSAALEVAMALTMTELYSIVMDPVEMALLCQRAENDFVGVQCGMMDQYISRLGEKGHALFIDCKTHEYEPIPFYHKEYQLVIVDSRVRRGLVNSHYNKRFMECKEAVEHFNRLLDHEISSLRDVSPEELKELGHQLPDTIGKRAHHVITENKRVLDSIEALRENNFPLFGSLMIESHHSLRDDFEVSSEELDLLVDIALAMNGVLGARMTGAGFGGCTVNLVKRERVEEFSTTILQKYYEKTERKPSIYMSEAVKGAGLLEV